MDNLVPCALTITISLFICESRLFDCWCRRCRCSVWCCIQWWGGHFSFLSCVLLHHFVQHLSHDTVFLFWKTASFCTAAFTSCAFLSFLALCVLRSLSLFCSIFLPRLSHFPSIVLFFVLFSYTVQQLHTESSMPSFLWLGHPGNNLVNLLKRVDWKVLDAVLGFSVHCVCIWSCARQSASKIMTYVM